MPGKITHTALLTLETSTIKPASQADAVGTRQSLVLTDDMADHAILTGRTREQCLACHARFRVD